MGRFGKTEQKKEQMTPQEMRIWELLKKKNIPIACLDERWLRLFPDSEKTPLIKKLEHELKELLKRQGKVNTDLKDIRVVRDKLTQSVLDTAEDTSIPENKRLKKQAASQRLIVEARQKQDNLELELDELPDKIKEANSRLAKTGTFLIVDISGILTVRTVIVKFQIISGKAVSKKQCPAFFGECFNFIREIEIC